MTDLRQRWVEDEGADAELGRCGVAVLEKLQSLRLEVEARM